MDVARSGTAAVALVVVMLAPALALGQEAREQARELAAQGRAHYEAGRFEEALEAYQAAYDLAPAPGVLFNLGQCYRHLGDCPHAVTSYERYLAEALDAPNREGVETLIEQCRTQMAMLTPAEPDAGPTQEAPDAGLASTDAEPVGVVPDGGPLTADADSDAVDGDLPVDVETNVDIASTDHLDGGIAAVTPPPTAAIEPPEEPPVETPHRPVWRRWWFWTILGCAVTGATVGAVVGVMAAEPETVLPGGSLGTLDGRGWSP